MQNFRKNFDLALSISPVFALKIIEIKLKLSIDIGILHLHENRINVWITRTIKDYAEANKKYINKFYQTKSSSFIMYLGFNNQYHYVVSE